MSASKGCDDAAYAEVGAMGYSLITNSSYGVMQPDSGAAAVAGNKVETASKYAHTHNYTKGVAFLFCLVAVVSLLGTVGACIAFATEISRLKSEMASLKAVSSSSIMADSPLESGLHAASSCAALPRFFPSGYYWVRASNGSAVRVYCDMTRSCGGVTGGWMRVAELNMTNSSHQCPSGFRQHNDVFCETIEESGGCFVFNNVEPLSIQYSKVCGQVIAYQFGTTNAFATGRSYTIDGPYVDGVSLTHGNPRQHIWTFAAARTENASSSICPCINREHETLRSNQLPKFVGNGDYFCDTGATRGPVEDTFFAADPLWDGAGCGPESTCCSFNNPPWFYKQLPQPTTDDIEMRVCRSANLHLEDILIQIVQIYVQ
jgi:hypothetical protein